MRLLVRTAMAGTRAGVTHTSTLGAIGAGLADFTDIQREEWTNRIGNLVLISRRKNSSQGNKEYADKKNKYFKSNIELFSNSVRIYNQFATWTFADIQKNQNEVITKIKNGFGI